VLAELNERGIEPERAGVNGAHIAEVLEMIDEGTLSNNLAKEVLAAVFDEGGERSPREVASDRGLEQISDEGELAGIVDRVVADNPEVVERIRGGADKAIGALVGQVMRETGGQANPRLVNELLRERVRA
jgi:aspartyl-tRNA(Asn)/glutamyl-tRNA(Gln) amidotransferase subunit B